MIKNLRRDDAQLCFSQMSIFTKLTAKAPKDSKKMKVEIIAASINRDRMIDSRRLTSRTIDSHDN